MKKRWIAGCAVSAFFLSACVAFWIEKPVLTQMLCDTVTTTANSKLNGTLSFSSMDISLSGNVLISKPVIRDMAGRVVLEGEDVSVYVNPRKIIPSLQKGAILEALDTVQVDKPVLHVWENETDGTWNVATLIKASAEKSDAGFRGIIRYQDGVIRARLPGGDILVADRADGSLSFAEYPTAIAITNDASLDGQHISLSGTYTSARAYRFVVQAEQIDAAYSRYVMPAAVDVSVNSGVIRNVKARVADGPDGFFLSGRADVAEGCASAYGLDIGDLHGHVELSTDEVRLTGVAGTINNQYVDIGGVIKTNTDTPVFNLDVRIPAASLDAFSSYLPPSLTGTAGFTGTVWGTVDDVSLQGRGSVSQLSYQGAVLGRGEADISYIHGRASLANLQAYGAGGSVTGEASYDVPSGRYAADLQASDIDMSQIPQIPVSVLGRVSADVQVAGSSKENTMQASGHVRAAGLSYNGFQADRAEGDVQYADGLIALQDWTLSAGGGTIQGGGTYDLNSHTPDLSFTASNIPLDMASPAVSVPLSGTVSAAGHVYGADWRWDMAINASHGAVQGMPFDTIDGTVRGAGTRIEIPALYWRYVDGLHTISGWADWESRAIQATVDTRHMRLEKLLPLVEKGDLPMTGWADNTVTVSGTLDNPSAAGSFRLTSGSCAGYLYKNISADYRLDQGTLYLSNGDISSYTASLAVHGSIGRQLDVYIEGKDLDISRIMPKNTVPRAGFFHVNAHVGGTPDNPTASGSLRADTLMINQMTLSDLRGDFAYYDDMLRLTDLHFMQNDGMYDANLLYRTSDNWMRGRASVSRGDIAGILQLANIPLQHVEGRIDGQIDIEGQADNPTATITGQITQAALAGQAVDPADIDIQLENGIVDIRKLSLSTADSLLAAKGTYAWHGPVNMQVAARNFPSRVLLDIVGQSDIDVDTPIDFAAELGGSGDALQANVSAQMNGGTINGVSFTNAFALLNIQDGIIHINQAYLARDPYKAAAYGDVPVSALHGGRGAEPMNVTLQLDNAGLDALTFLTPYVSSAQGGITGSLKLGGTLASPEIHVSLGVENGTIQFRDVAYPLDHVTGTVTFDGTSVTADASGTMDKKGAKDPGTVTLQGNAAWQGWKLTRYEGDVDIAHLRIDCDYFNGPLDGHISLSPGDTAPKVSGILNIHDTTLNLPLSFSDSTAPPEVELDFTIAIGDKVRLYNPALYDLMIQGAANFKGTANHPRPSGRFEAQRGTIHYLDTNFTISKAKADFSQMDAFLPVVDLEGTSRVGQYGVLLTLKGPADNMDMLLRSNPPLTKQQIVSLITLRNSSGKQQSSLSEEDVDTLVGSGIRMTLNSLGITQELEKALALDMLTVTNGSLNLNDKNTDMSRNYYNIEMGKYLFNNFMVTAAFGLNHDDNRFGMQYDLGSKFSLNAWTSDDDNFVGGMYRYSFY